MYIVVAYYTPCIIRFSKIPPPKKNSKNNRRQLVTAHLSWRDVFFSWQRFFGVSLGPLFAEQSPGSVEKILF